MSDARLTVKVRLQAASLADSAESVAGPAPFSPRRILMALLVLLGLAWLTHWGWRQLSPVDPEQTAAAQRLLAQEGEADSDEAIEHTESAEVTTAPTEAVIPQESSRSEPVSASPAASSTPVATGVPAASTATTSANGVAASRQAEPLKAEPLQVEPIPAEPLQTKSSQSQPRQADAIHAVSTDTMRAKPLPPGFSRIVLTATMENLQPGAAVGHQVAYPQIKRLYLFTELKGYAGQVIKHRWFYQGQLHTEAVLTIEDSPWRTYSENWLLDDQRGDWYVEIVDQAQNLLYRYDFHYQ